MNHMTVGFLALVVCGCSAGQIEQHDQSTLSIGSEEIYHLGFTVENLDTAMAEWQKNRGFGPFFVIRGFAFEDPQYRGETAAPEVDLAFAFNGRLMVELMHQRDETPSVYTETITASGYGFHHFAYLSDNVDVSVRAAEAAGDTCVFRANFAGGRLAYCQTSLMDAGFVEYVERNQDIEALLNVMYQAALDWDGSEPVRNLM